jgi:cytochrome c-type biogenesis protein CcmH
MLFWLVFVIMTAAAVLAALWPLARARKSAATAREADLAVYRDQLAEIERDRASGLLADAEAAAVRVEVSRRLLAADAAGNERTLPGALGRRRVAAVLALAGVPLLALTLYGALGSPGLPDAPLAGRVREEANLANLVKSVEAKLAERPDDGRGWEVLVPYYLSVGRYEDALKAQEKVLQLLGPSPEREAGLGETLAAVAKGAVTPEARAAFDRAIAMNANNPKALFFLGLADLQAERRDSARANWLRVLEVAPPGNRWAGYAREQLDRLGNTP